MHKYAMLFVNTIEKHVLFSDFIIDYDEPPTIINYTSRAQCYLKYNIINTVNNRTFLVIAIVSLEFLLS